MSKSVAVIFFTATSILHNFTQKGRQLSPVTELPYIHIQASFDYFLVFVFAVLTNFLSYALSHNFNQPKFMPFCNYQLSNFLKYSCLKPQILLATCFVELLSSLHLLRTCIDLILIVGLKKISNNLASMSCVNETESVTFYCVIAVIKHPAIYLLP